MKQGFTLIELLIVVAIIAILAAIAVPNFLDAQTRSKVARVHSDLRTYDTAIKAYTTDYNRASPGYTEINVAYPGTAVGNRQIMFKFLTTPVAYLSTLPTDPFGQLINNRREALYYFYNTFYQGGVHAATRLPALRDKGYVFALYSLGPARTEGSPWIEDMLFEGAKATGTGAAGPNIDNIYDPTNGTVSRGKIYRTSKGILTGDF